MKEINVKIKGEFITLVQLLKFESLISSGGEVKLLLNSDKITHNGLLATEKRKKCYVGDVLVIDKKIKIIII